MAKILYIGRHATDDPTMASFPFVSALGAADAGHRAEIALLGEAAYLMKGAVADQVHGVGFPALSELLLQVVDRGIQIYV